MFSAEVSKRPRAAKEIRTNADFPRTIGNDSLLRTVGKADIGLGQHKRRQRSVGSLIFAVNSPTVAEPESNDIFAGL